MYAPLLVAVRSEENYILKLLLDALGGYVCSYVKFVLSWSLLLTYMYNINTVQEKALRDATEAGAQNLVEALSQLDEMVGHCVYIRSKTTHVT